MSAKFASLMEFFLGQHSMLLKRKSPESTLILLCANIMNRVASPLNDMQSMKQRNKDRQQSVNLKPVHTSYERYYIFPKKHHPV